MAERMGARNPGLPPLLPGMPAPAPGTPAYPEHREARTETERAYDAIRELSERDRAFAQKEFGEGRFWKLKAWMAGQSWRETGMPDNPREPNVAVRLWRCLRDSILGEDDDPNYDANAARVQEIARLGEHAHVLGMDTNYSAARKWGFVAAKTIGGAALAASMPLAGGFGMIASAPLFIAGFREAVDGTMQGAEAIYNFIGDRLKAGWREQDRARGGQPDTTPGMWAATTRWFRNFVEKTTTEDENPATVVGRPRPPQRDQITAYIRELKALAAAPHPNAAEIQRVIRAMHLEERRLQEVKDHNLTTKRLRKFGRNCVSTITSFGTAAMTGIPLGFNDKAWWQWWQQAGITDKLLVPLVALPAKTLAAAGPSLAYLAARWTEFSWMGHGQHFGDNFQDWKKNLQTSHEYTGERVSQEKTVADQYIERDLHEFCLPGTAAYNHPGQWERALDADAERFSKKGEGMDPGCRLVITIDAGQDIDKVLASYSTQIDCNDAPVPWRQIEFLILNDKSATAKDSSADAKQKNKIDQALAKYKKENSAMRIRVINQEFKLPPPGPPPVLPDFPTRAEEVRYKADLAAYNAAEAARQNGFAPERAYRVQKYLNDLALVRSVKRPNRVQKPLYVVNGSNNFGGHDRYFISSLLEAGNLPKPPLVMTGASHEIRQINPLFRRFLPGLDRLENDLEHDWPRSGFVDNNFHAFRVEEYARVGGTQLNHDITSDILNHVGVDRERRQPTDAEQQAYLAEELTNFFRWYALYPTFAEFRGRSKDFQEQIIASPRMAAPRPVADQMIMHGDGRASFVRWMERRFGFLEGTHYRIRNDTRQVVLLRGAVDAAHPHGANWPFIRHRVEHPRV